MRRFINPLIEKWLTALFPMQPLTFNPKDLTGSLDYQYRLSRTVGYTPTRAIVGVRIQSIHEGLYVRGGDQTRSLRSEDRPLVAIYPFLREAPEPTTKDISIAELEKLNA